MWVFCHRAHAVEDYANHVMHKMMPGFAYGLPDALARQVTAACPSRLCLIPDGQDAHAHRCKLTKEVEAENRRMAEHAMLEAPPEDSAMRVRRSPQHRRQLHDARRRSGIARRAGYA